MSKDNEQWIDEVLKKLQHDTKPMFAATAKIRAEAKATIKAKLVEARIDEINRMSSRCSTITDWTEQGVKLLPAYLYKRFTELQGLGEHHE